MGDRSGARCPTLAGMLAEAALLVALTVQHGVGAEACLGEPRLKRNVEKRLRRRVFAEPAEAQLRFTVSYEQRGDRIEARVDVSSSDGTPRGSRSLVTEGHCSKLDDSLSLSVALLADQPPDPEPALEPLPTPAPEAAPPSSPPPPPRPRAAPTPLFIPADVSAPREPWHVAVGAAFQGTWGVLPGVTPGVSVLVTVLPPHVMPLTVAGEMFTTRTAERDSSSGARFRLLRIALSLCPRLLQGPGRDLALCFGQKVGWLRVDGFGFDRDLSERRLSYALHLGVEARQQLFSRVSLRGSLGAEAPMVRDRFVSSGRDAAELFRPSVLGFAAQLGLEASLW
jgi:hypothetical protein